MVAVVILLQSFSESVVVAGKRGSRRDSTTSISENVVVAEQVINCKKFCHFAIGRGLKLLQYT